MIIDFRNHIDAITPAELSRWRSVGATTILFTVHHPDRFSDESLSRLRDLSELIRSHDLQPGIYTGLLGMEKESTIRAHRLGGLVQRQRDGAPVLYDRKRRWGVMFCPNSAYFEDYKLPLLGVAVQRLGLGMVFFDLPWYRVGGCYCPTCREEFLRYIEFRGFGAREPGGALEELADRYCALYGEFLRFKVDSIHRAMRRATASLKERFPHLSVLYNMGSHLSNLDNQHEGSWLEQGVGIGSDLMVEYNPWARDVKTPVAMVGASVRLARSALSGPGKVVFASTISSSPGDPKSMFYPPDKLMELYGTIRRSGGIPYLSYATSNPNLDHRRPAPIDEYFDMYAQVNRIEADVRTPQVAVVYSRTSYHFAVRSCLQTVRGDQVRKFKTKTSQNQYLLPVWSAILALEGAAVPYAVVPSNHSDLSVFPELWLPRAVALWDHEVRSLREYVKRGGRLVLSGEAGRLNGRGEPREEPALAVGSRVDDVGLEPAWEDVLQRSARP